MAIKDFQYDKIADYLYANLDATSKSKILNNDFTPLKKLILNELILNDYMGFFLDIIMEDLCTISKKPLLVTELDNLAEFLLSDLSLYIIKSKLSKRLKK